jgi:hypothetical protein
VNAPIVRSKNFNVRQVLNSALAVLAIAALLLSGVTSIEAQPGPTFSASYDFYPYSRIKDPDTSGGNTFLETSEIGVNTLDLSMSYPLVFAEGRTVLVNEMKYRNLVLDYRGFPPNDVNPDNLHALEYNATLTHGLSDRWTLMAIATPGIASDFEDGIKTDDLTFQAVAVFIRAYSERLQIGYGVAWSNTFGQPFPLPVLALQWNNGSNLRVSSILPTNIEAWYAPTKRLELGFQVGVDGNRYHGDPDLYGVDNPLLSYSVGTFGPAVNYHLSEKMTLGIRAGRTFTRRFEFFDGGKDVQDFSLENSNFLKVQIEAGL